MHLLTMDEDHGPAALYRTLLALRRRRSDAVSLVGNAQRLLVDVCNATHAWIDLQSSEGKHFVCRVKGHVTDRAPAISLSHDVRAEGLTGAIGMESDAAFDRFDRDRFDLFAHEVEVVAPWLLADVPLSLDAELRAYRRHRALDELEKHQWNVAAAARALQVPRTNLYVWVKNLRICRPGH
jgi:hypothetical protein